MEESKKPNFVQRLLLNSRRRSLSAVSSSKSKNQEDPLMSPPSASSSSSNKDVLEDKDGASVVAQSAEAPALARGRSGTAAALISRSSGATKDKESTENYEKNPHSVDELPKGVTFLYLTDIITQKEEMNANFELTLRVLRLIAKKEHRHYSFLRAVGPKSEEPDAIVSVFSEVPTEKAVRRRYRVGDEIGKGAFGLVYEGKYEGKSVALKKISNIGERAIKRNRQEAFYLSKCHHDKILRLHASLHALDTNTVWLVMELIQGGSLDEAINTAGPLPEPEAASVCKDLLMALTYLHDQCGFVHRDVKPANAMLSLEEQKKASVKLVDFSLCHNMTDSKNLTHAVGTLMFMPPEMTLREPHDQSCDVWSLGITAVFLLIGKGPFKSSFDAMFRPASKLAMPKLPSGFSEAADSFVAAACSLKESRPTAKTLLEHPWVKSAASPDQMWRLVKTVFRHNCINNVIGGI